MGGDRAFGRCWPGRVCGLAGEARALAQAVVEVLCALEAFSVSRSPRLVWVDEAEARRRIAGARSGVRKVGRHV